MDLDLYGYALGAVSAVLIGFSKTGIPGVSLPAVLLMTYAFAGKEMFSVGAILPILLAGDVMAAAYYRRHTQWKQLFWLLPTVAAGMIPGTYIMATVDHSQFKLILGIMVLGLLVLEAGRQWFGWEGFQGNWLFTVLMGLLAGFGTVVGNAAGPAMSIYLLSKGLEKEQFMGAWAWFFLIVNAAKVPIFIGLGTLTPDTLHFSLMMLPFIGLGAFVGRRLLSVTSQEIFDALVLILAGVAALQMVLA